MTIRTIAVENSWDIDWDATEEGFDAKVLFQPRWNRLSLLDRIPIKGKSDLRVYDYGQAAQILSEPDAASYRRYETAAPRVRRSAAVIRCQRGSAQRLRD